MTEAKQKLGVDEEWTTLRRSRSKLLNSRGNQVLMAFTYWQPQFDHLSKKIFELRSYTLKVGSGSPDPQVISMVTMIYIHTVYMVLMLIWCLVKQYHYWQTSITTPSPRLHSLCACFLVLAQSQGTIYHEP